MLFVCLIEFCDFLALIIMFIFAVRPWGRVIVQEVGRLPCMS